MSADTSALKSETPAEDWLDRLDRLCPGLRDCGFAVYHHPILLRATSLGKIRARYDLQLEPVVSRIGFFNPGFCLQPLPWPNDLQYDHEVLVKETAALTIAATSDDEESSEDEDFDDKYPKRYDFWHINLDRGRRPKWLTSIYRQCRVPNASGQYKNSGWHDTGILTDRDADHDLKRIFGELRADFRRFRDQARIYLEPRAKHIESGFYDGLLHGMLDSCFVVVDPYSAITWWDKVVADRSWVWVVDADFEGPRSTVNGVTEEYQGYLRVHLKEICNNFLEARIFHPNVTLRAMWDIARQNNLKAFTSLDGRNEDPSGQFFDLSSYTIRAAS